ncbi:MAG: hypothetical protein GEV09_10610 [Pseudonocardiaceae bacterium]|nr:hypothetical protein [Pseudonocardiaceae bacterium]
MTGPDERPSRLGGGRSAGRLLVPLAIALGVVAAAVLALGADDPRLLRLGVVAALWAALVGAFATVRMRRAAASDADRAENLRAIYQLELEREVSARREHELTVERTVRQEVEQSSRDELEALRTELRTLRENLENLLGGELLVERVALRESTRLRSLTEQQEPAPDRRAVTVPADRSASGPRTEPVAGSSRASGQSGLPRRDPTARSDPSRRPPPEAPAATHRTSYADDPLFADAPWQSDQGATSSWDRSPLDPAGGGREQARPPAPDPAPAMAQRGAAAPGQGAHGQGAHGQGAHGQGAQPGRNGQRPRADDGDGRRVTEEPQGAHSGGRSVEDLISAYGAGPVPRRRHRRQDE